MRKYYKIILLFLIIGSTAYNIKAQNNKGKADDFGRIVLNTFIPNQIEGMPASAKKMLANKVSQIATKNGMGGSASNPRFIITANVSVLTKDITATAPPMHAYTLEISLFIGDGLEGTLFSTTSLELKGVGKTEAKAYIGALKRINYKNPVFKEFIDEGKTKIMEYYNSKCDILLKEASTLADNREFDFAIAKMMEVPDVCKECYDKAMDKSNEIFNKKLEFECQQNISSAKSLIAQDSWDEAAGLLSLYTPDLACYPEVATILEEVKDHKCAVNLGKAKGAWAERNSQLAAGFLSQVPSDSKCAEEAKLLSQEIASKLDEKEKKEWDLAYEKYNRNQSYKENQEYELKKAQIASNTEVGVAKAKSDQAIGVAKAKSDQAIGVAKANNSNPVIVAGGSNSRAIDYSNDIERAAQRTISHANAASRDLNSAAVEYSNELRREAQKTISLAYAASRDLTAQYTKAAASFASSL